MAIISPQTNIKLLKVPLCIDNTNQLTFSNATTQYNYFNSLPKLEYDNCTFQRKDNYIAVNVDMDSLLEYNYVMYQNSQYGDDKWFYAYITKMEYQNNKCTYVYIKTDVYQTWQFDITFKRSFVEREHTNNDTIGANTVPENVELGEYCIQKNNASDDEDYNNLFNFLDRTVNDYVCMYITKIPSPSGYAYPNDNNINGVFSGLYLITFPDYSNAKAYLDFVEREDANNSVVACFLAPHYLVYQNLPSNWNTYTDGTSTFQFAFLTNINYPQSAQASSTPSITKPSYLDGGYYPVNKKLLTFPYCYFNLSNNCGETVSYHYEKFNTNKCYFASSATINVGCDIKLIPQNYNCGNSSYNFNQSNYSEAITSGKLPTCTWVNDTYQNWIKQNALNNTVNAGSSMIKTVLGLALMTAGTFSGFGLEASAMNKAFLAGGGLALSSLKDVKDSITSWYEHQLVPPSAVGGTNTGNWWYGNKKAFSLYKMSIKTEYARIIDEFFSMYGYKTNRVKIPNRTGRANWNYVKTIGCNIIGNIPQDDLKEIKTMFDNGITLWHNTTTFLDYSQANPIV